MSTYKAHINTLMSELHDYDESILITSDIKNKPLLANCIDRSKVSLDIHSVTPLCTLDYCDPIEQSNPAPWLSLVILLNPSRTYDSHSSSDLTAKIQINSRM